MAKKVLIGMSGGIDSSVAACLLKEQGYEVTGVHMRFWHEPVTEVEAGLIKPENKCCSIESWEIAAEVAKKINIPFLVFDLEKEFKDEIVDYYLDEQKNANTPNPCVECNRRIKFGKFLELMEKQGADFVATGHYLQKTLSQCEGHEVYELHVARDLQKDQSYFLYTLNQEKLAHVLFPLGPYTKPEVRHLAVKFGVDFINKKKESQNLCFISEKDPKYFLQRNLHKSDFKPGPIFSVEGRLMGNHVGLPAYTIGQRKGIGIGGQSGDSEKNPWYVVGMERGRNALIIGKEKDLYASRVTLKKISFVNNSVQGKIQAKIRFRSFPADAMLQLGEEGTATVLFDHPQRAVTPGQSMVFYAGDLMLGGGVIEKVYH